MVTGHSPEKIGQEYITIGVLQRLLSVQIHSLLTIDIRLVCKDSRYDLS